MPLTLLQLVQRSAVRLGIAQPQTALTSTAATQLVEFSRESGEDLLKRHDWQILRTRFSFPGTATQALQDDHDRFAPPGQGELWTDATRYSPCRGPLDTLAWDALLERISAGANPPYWALIGDVINIYPAPAASVNFTYTYIKNAWINPSGGGARVTDWTTDSDTTVFPDDAMRYGMIWRWRQAKGFDYAEDLASAERAIERAISRDRGPRVVNTSNPWAGIPGDPWPDGYWPGTITP